MTEANITVYGAPWCPDCTRAKQFLGEQRVRYNWVDIDQDEDARAYVQQVNDGKQIIPTIIFEDGSLLVEPSNAELAAKLGIQPKARRDFYDLIVVGGGPAGLSTALYAAREGIETLVVESSAIGGQAGVTERIDNYLGFPDGVEGARLADDMRSHAERFGAEMLPAQSVAEVRADDTYRTIVTESEDEYGAMALLLAVGTRYRRLNVPGEEDFIGAGIHFCATCDGPFYKGGADGRHRRRQQRPRRRLVPDALRRESNAARQGRQPSRESDSAGESRKSPEDEDTLQHHGSRVSGRTQALRRGGEGRQKQRY